MLNMPVTGQTMIFKNDKGFYLTSIGKKKQDGEYENGYMNVAFRKGTDIPDKTLINITNGFITFDTFVSKVDNKRTTVWKIFVLDFEIPGQTKTVAPKQEESAIIASSTDEDDLPF